MAKRSTKLIWLSRLLVLAAIIIVIIGGVAAWQQWRDNKTADKNAAAAQDQANHGHATGSDPSTNKPSWTAFEEYRVAADLPRYIFIPKIGVTAMVKQVGLTKDGAIGSPSNVYDAAWYTGSAKPGQKGAMLIDGHVSSWTTNGVFYNLKKLEAGDRIKIEKGDGDMLKYKVVKTMVYPHDKVDMKQVLAPITPGKPGLNIITCTGDVIKGTNEFSQRIAVFTEQV